MDKIECNEDYKIILKEFLGELSNLVEASASHKEALKFISSEFAHEKKISSLEISLTMNCKFHINNNEPHNEFVYPIVIKKIYQMNSIEDKTEQIKQIISEWFVAKGKIADEKNINHIIGKLSKSLQLIENEYHITCHWDNLDGNEQKIGNRVCLIYDKEHYFLMRMAEPNSGKVFAPHVDRESALQTFNELENNGDIQFENE